MDPTVLVAIFGIGGTLLSPVVLEWTRRRGQFTNRAMDVYAELLTFNARIADTAGGWATWARDPTTDTPVWDEEELRRLVGRVQIVAGRRVYRATTTWWSAVGTFYHLLVETRAYYQTLPDQPDQPDADLADPRAIEMLTMLRNQASQVEHAYTDVELAIRRELRPFWQW
jgi:hypothetical protein